MSRPAFAPEPAAAGPAVREEELAVRVAAATSARSSALGAGVRRGTPQSATFGVVAAGLRSRLGLSRAQMAVRSGLDPVYLTMLEGGLLGPDEIPAAAVAMLAVGLGRPLGELPVLPYEPGEEPAGETQVEDGRVRLDPGLAALVPWVEARLRPAGAPPAPVQVPLPDCSITSRSGTWRVSGELSSQPVPGAELDDYSWQVVSGRPGRQDSWWAHLRAVDSGGEPAPGLEIRVQVGPYRAAAVTDAQGRVTFERVDPATIEPIRLVVR